MLETNTRIEADWTLLNTCNFRCHYCFLSEQALSEKIVRHTTPEAWIDAFRSTGRAWDIHVTGGEPTAYPDFMPLMQGLCVDHFISLNSNLTSRNAAKMANVLAPDRVLFINAGLHIDERTERGKLDVFVDNFLALKHAGFRIFCTLVATESVIDRYSEIAAQMHAKGVYPIPKLMRGKVNGRHYPTAYSAHHRDVLLNMFDAAREVVDDVSPYAANQVTIDARVDKKLLVALKKSDRIGVKRLLNLKQNIYRGKMCAAGVSFVSIRPDGRVHRCSTKQALGNLLDGSFQLMDRPTPCDTRYCPYFCEKYTQADQLLPMPRVVKQTDVVRL